MQTQVTLSSVPPTDGSAPQYESTKFHEEYGIYIAHFNKSFGFDVPAGEHTLTVDVAQGDWVGISSYLFTGYVSNRFPRVDLYGITNGSNAYLWAHNPDHNWMYIKENNPLAPIRGLSTVLHGLAPGTYTCEWWDTWKSQPVQTGDVACENNALTLSVPDLEKDLAVAITLKK